MRGAAGTMALMTWRAVALAVPVIPARAEHERGHRARAARDRPRDVNDVAFLAMVLGAAAGAGVLGAILGLGGGILLVPVLTLFFGVSLPYAMGASILSVIATSCGAAAGHL